MFLRRNSGAGTKWKGMGRLEKRAERARGRYTPAPSAWERKRCSASVLQLHEPRFNRIANQPGGVVNVQFLHQICPVGIDGPDAQKQCLGDLTVGEALCNILQHLDLAFGELLLGM